MKKLLISCVLFFVASNISFSQSSNEEQLKILIQHAFDDVLSDLNVESLSDYFTSDFILLEHGEVWDIDMLKNMLQSDSMKGIERLNNFVFIEVKVNGDNAWLAYHNKATFKKGEEIVGEMNWLESATAVRTENGWRMNMLHSTRKSKAD